jgi:hypothetical protein
MLVAKAGSIEELAYEQRDAVPGKQLLAFFPIGIPIYLVRCRAHVKQEARALPLHAFVVRLLALRQRSVAELGTILALEPRVVGVVVGDLERRGHVLVTRRGRGAQGDVVTLGRKLGEYARQGRFQEAQTLDAQIAIDALTAEAMAVPGPRSRHTLNRLRDLGVRIISPIVEEPKESVLLGAVGDRQVLVPELRAFSGQSKPTVLAITEVSAAEIHFLTAQVLAYGAGSSVDEVRVFWRKRRHTDWEDAIREAEADDLRPLPMERIPVEESREVRADDVKEDAVTVDEPQASASRRLRVWEHRPTMIKAIEDARERLMIVAPWITAEATDAEVMNGIEAALRRGVEVFIGYGIADDTSRERERPPDPRVMDKLRRLETNRRLRGRLVVRRLQTHEKIFLKDDDTYIVGSFNWLSFRGDRRRGLRRESSELISDRTVVRARWEEFLVDFRDARTPPD